MLYDPNKIKHDVVSWIQDYFTQFAPGACAVVGISGGKDSSVVAALCAEALGKDRVMGVLMPDGEQPDIEDSRTLVDHLGIRAVEVNIGPIHQAYKQVWAQTPELKELCDGMSQQTTINLPPRLRLATLYAVAQSLPGGALVANTCNRSEDYVGYSTKYGDAAGDFAPLGDLLVSEVIQLGKVLGLPAYLLEKPSADGLSGKTDEDKLGFTYDTLEQYLNTGICDDPAVKEKIDRLHQSNLHKLQPIPTFQQGGR